MSSAIKDAALDARLAAIVLEEIQAVARERARRLTLQTRLADLGLDSLEFLDVIGRIERACRVRISDADGMTIETCRDIVLAVARQQGQPSTIGAEIPPGCWRLDETPEYLALQRALVEAKDAGEGDPYFAVHDSISRETALIAGRELINFSGNNYLGMSGDPDVTAAAQEALNRYGTSVSASRLVSGTRGLHVELEREIAEFLGTEKAITFTSGQATNITVIGHLMGRSDLILHDELVHNSILAGARLSGATRRAFPHNDWQALGDILDEVRHEHRKVLVVIEGVYSMDGDCPDVPQFIEVKRRHKALLYIDEAHSIGTLGASGRGIGELQGIQRHDVDIWMGTLSKALGACGGFVAGSEPLVKLLKYTCPGVIYTVGLAPSSAAAALTAIRKLKAGSERVAALQARSREFLSLAKERGFHTGASSGTPIVPVILGNSLQTLAAARRLHERGISVPPIIHPAVREEGARLRFFISALHTPEQLRISADVLAEVLAGLERRT
jgi:8-amino-7-oxononanoate synthase